MNDWPIFKPQHPTAELTPHPNRLQLVQGGAGPIYPPLCPNCGATASRSLTLRKVFCYQRSRAPSTFRIESVNVPFCDACIAGHEREERHLTPLQTLLVSLGHGCILSALASGWIAFMLLPDALADLARPDPPVALLVVLLLAAISAVSLFACWHLTARRRVPPPTSISQAFDFSARHAELFEAPRVTYAIRDRGFAVAFRSLNRERMWSSQGPQARRAARWREFAFGAAAVALVVVLLLDAAHDLF